MKSQAALAAQQIRKILKQVFPNNHFKVESSNFSMGDSVEISWDWSAGVNAEAVEKLIGHFQKGTFNGIDDSYHFNKTNAKIPQTKFLNLWHRVI